MALGSSKTTKSPLSGRSRRVLIMGDEGIVLYAVAKKKATRLISLPWEAPNFNKDAVAALNQKHRGSVLVLVDSVEQYYRKEKIPNVGAMDRPKIVKRDLAMAFPNFTIRQSMEIKKPKKRGEKSNTKERLQYLFAALPDTPNLKKVVDVLFEAEVSIAGVGLLPLESTGLVDELATRCVEKSNGKRSKWTILIGQNETSGLRQVVTRNGNLALTRMTPLPDAATGANLSGEIIRELKASLSYIPRHGYQADDGLDFIVIAPKESHEALKMARLPVTNICCMDTLESVRTLGGDYQGNIAQTYADPLYALWGAKKSKLTLPMKVPALEKISLPRKLAQFSIIGAFLIVIGLLWMMYQSYAAYTEATQEIQSRKTQKSALTRDYEQESQIFSELPRKPEVVNNVLAVKRMLEDNSIDVTPMMQRLQTALQNEFLVKNISVRHVAPEDTSIAQASSTAPRSMLSASSTGDDKEDIGENGQITVALSVYPVNSQMPLEEKVNRAEALLTRLQEAMPEHNIELSKQFGGISRTGKFSSKTVENDQDSTLSAVENAEFTIKGPPL